MKRTAVTLMLMLAAVASAAVDVRAGACEGEGQKTQWAPTRNFSTLNARVAFASESRAAASPYAGERLATAAGAGIFLSRDSFEGVLTEAPSLHRYTYAHNQPLKYRDPSGRFIEEVIGVLTRPPMPYDTPEVAEIKKTLEEAPSVVTETYETAVGSMILDPAHAAATEASQGVAYRATSPLRSVGADTYANLNSAGVSAVGQFAVDAAFGVANLVLRPHRVIEGIGRLPGQAFEGVKVAADSNENLDRRIRGAAQTLGAVSQMALIALGAVDLLGLKGPTISFGRGVRPSPVAMRPANQEWWGGETLEPGGRSLADPLTFDQIPTSPGVYHIEAGGEFYTGSSFEVQRGVKGRLLGGNHPKAEKLMSCADCVVEVQEISLGSAKTQSEKQHVARYHEQLKMNEKGNVPNQGGSLNSNRATAEEKMETRAEEARRLGSTQTGVPKRYVRGNDEKQ